MSTEIFKAFADVSSLQSDGSNYQIWHERATIVATGCGVGKLLSQAAGATEETAKNALRAALMNKLPDSIFLTVKSKTDPHEIMLALKARFGMSTAITQATSLERLYTLKCTDDRKVQTHLDSLILIKDQLAEQSVTVSDENFLAAIISSIPQGYKPVVVAYKNSIRVHNSSATAQTKLDPYELINLLRVEAQSHAAAAAVTSSSSHKGEESAHTASYTQRGSGRGRGRGN